MSLRIFRRVWITLSNLTCLGLITARFLQDYELSNLHGGGAPPGKYFELAGSLVCAAVLLLGIIFEWLDWTRSAFLVNTSIFAIFGIAVLGKAALMVLTKSPTQYDPEAGLAVAIVGIPFTVIALADLLLYRVTRPTVSERT
jgi:hypothetical protein